MQSVETLWKALFKIITPYYIKTRSIFPANYCCSYNRQELPKLYELQNSPSLFLLIFFISIFCLFVCFFVFVFILYIYLFVRLRPVSCVPHVTRVSGLSLSDIYISMYLYTPFNISQIQLRGGWVSKRKLYELSFLSDIELLISSLTHSQKVDFE